MSSETKSDSVKLSYTELTSFFENMGMMIKSGISVSEAIDLLKEETPASEQAMKDAFAKMSDDLNMGKPFGDAMRDSGAFPDYSVDMISTSEYTGKLEDTLFHLADYYRTENSMKTALVSAVRYPVILLFMVIAVLIASSVAVCTPLAIPANSMILVPGNLRFKDFLKPGLALSAVAFLLQIRSDQSLSRVQLFATP